MEKLALIEWILKIATAISVGAFVVFALYAIVDQFNRGPKREEKEEEAPDEYLDWK